jgi:hypothetical protein
MENWPADGEIDRLTVNFAAQERLSEAVHGGLAPDQVGQFFAADPEVTAGGVRCQHLPAGQLSASNSERSLRVVDRDRYRHQPGLAWPAIRSRGHL